MDKSSEQYFENSSLYAIKFDITEKNDIYKILN